MTDSKESNAIGSYANFLAVGHNAFEFVLDFGQLYQGAGDAQMHTRIVTTPAYAKAMLQTLQTSLEQFEASYGEIHSAEDAQP